MRFFKEKKEGIKKILSPKKEEVSFYIGRVANRLGMSGNALKRHLVETGLMERCIYDRNGWRKVPLSLLKELIPQEDIVTLLRKPGKREKSSRVEIENEEVEQPPKSPYTYTDFLRWAQSQQEEKNQ